MIDLLIWLNGGEDECEVVWICCSLINGVHFQKHRLIKQSSSFKISKTRSVISASVSSFCCEKPFLLLNVTNLLEFIGCKSFSLSECHFSEVEITFWSRTLQMKSLQTVLARILTGGDVTRTLTVRRGFTSLDPSCFRGDGLSDWTQTNRFQTDA